MKKIAVVTATRAEYGLLSPVIKELRKHENNTLKAELIVTGAHLSESYGMTVNEIDDRIDYKVPVSVKSSAETDISINQAEILVKFTELFLQQKYNAIILLGDRYEALAIAVAAGNTRTPIFHLCGGDTTEGALDEWIRHSITKMSYLHFVTNDESKKRVIQLGESPDRVFNYGSTSLDNIFFAADMNKAEALESVGLKDCRYAICTYHPVTMEKSSVDEQISELLEAIRAFPDIEFIVTKSNADHGGARINELLDEAGSNIDNFHVYTSLGIRRYLSLMRYAEFVLGNSSSGIIEAPVFQIPTVNIGNRQRGRLQSESVINCTGIKDKIVEAVGIALSERHRKKCREGISLYGTGDAGRQIADEIVKVILSDNEIDLKKKFYNIRGYIL